MQTAKFPVTTTSTLISHMGSAVRVGNTFHVVVRAMRNATRGGRNGVKTRSAATLGQLDDYSNTIKTIDAQSRCYLIRQLTHGIDPL